MPDPETGAAADTTGSRVGDLRTAIRLCLALGLRDAVHARTLVPLGAGLHGEQVHVDLALGGGGRARLFLAPAGGEPWLAAGTRLKLAIDGTAPAGGFGALAARLQPALDRVEFARLVGLFGPADAPGRDGAPSPTPPDAAPEPPHPPLPEPGAGIDSWGHPAKWRDFGCHRILEDTAGETFLGNFALGPNTRIVRHGDLECVFSTAWVRGRASTPYAFSPRAPRGPAPAPMQITLLDDRDLVMGTGVRRLDGLVGELATDAADADVHFINCCLPMMTGEDVWSILARHERRTGKPVMFTDISPRHSYGEGMLKRLVAARREWATVADRDPASYNLVGFPPGRDCDELVALLAAAGATLNAAPLPEVDLGGLGRLARASVQVFLPVRARAAAYEALAPACPGAVRNVAPYGRAGTDAWLQAVADALGGDVAVRMPACRAAEATRLAPAWDVVTAEARRHRVAFVLGPGDGGRLGDPAASGGVRLPHLLEELGFAIDLLALEVDGADASTGAQDLLGTLADPSRHRRIGFATPADLRDRFRTGGFALVYSNVRNDDRLARDGLAGFSLADVERGAAGALRTARRLLERCRMTFFRDYRDYLGGS